ncbi:MAG: 16S rRNA (uracil(1498)-N(3))-methyltransferase [Ruminococcus sp.]|nr:16S rRNA (uracil(1498)-N(3))-methyltransferase [Ruminococcus sp.]
MAWFFTNEISGDIFEIEGEDARHISKSLRMKVGESLTLCTLDGRRHECEITAFSTDSVTVKVLSSTICEQEPSVKITLFMALTKGDKMDDIVQKSVELGVYEIVPVLTARCISRPDEKQIKKKVQRWQKISDNAASQSRRGIIPQVKDMMTLKEASNVCNSFDKAIVFYECGGEKLRDIIDEDIKTLAMFVGSEGGFEESEIDILKANGVTPTTLGTRILRAQTAPIAGITAVMYQTKNLE